MAATTSEEGALWSVSTEETAVDLDLRHTLLRQSPQFRVSLRNATALIRDRPGAASDRSLLLLLAAATSTPPRLLLKSPFTKVEVQGGRVLLENSGETPEVSPIAQDLQVNLERLADDRLRLLFQGRLGKEASPSRLDLLVHSEANSLRVLASGHCRLTRGVFLEGQHLELRHTPTALLISAPNLRLNGAALRISATVPHDKGASGRLTIESQRLRLAPLVDTLWADLRGALDGEITATATAVTPSIEQVHDWAAWSLEASVTARRVHWSGVNLLYGLIQRAHRELVEQNSADLPRSVRQRFASELLPAETRLNTVEATIRLAHQEVELTNVTLQGSRYRIGAAGVLSLSGGPPMIDSSIELYLDSDLAASLCETESRYCQLRTDKGELVLHYRWKGDATTTLPTWLSPSPSEG